MGQKIRFVQLATITLFLGCCLLFFRPAAIGADNDVAPLNLSRSGAATAPVVVAEANGSLHVIWQDRFAGFVYTSGSGSNWTEPTAVALPFSSPPFSTPASDDFSAMFTPRLLLDGQGIVYAFWQVDGALAYSNAPLAEISNGAAWIPPQTLAASAPAYAVTVATDGRLHLAYIRTASSEDFPAGVYYRQRTDEGWSNARQLYQSNYLRAAAVDQLHVDIAVIGAERVFITWDNYLADAVFYVRSSDAGSSWPEPIALDQREEDDSFDAPGPHYLQLVAHENDVHLLWNRYSSVGRCELSHRLAADGGREWQPRQILFEGTTCPPRRHGLVDASTGRLHLFTEQEQGSAAVRTWLDTTWSPPQSRSSLFSFTNRETFRSVNLACFRPVAAQDQLLIVGCGQGNVEDVWLVTSDLPDPTQFADDAAERWQPPAQVARLSNRQYEPVVLSGQDGMVHALWLEYDPTLLTGNVPEVRYAHWDGVSWSRPAPIVEGEIDQITAVINSNNRLLLAWRDLQQGSVWLKQVDVAQAAFPAQWSPPKEVVVNETAVSQPLLMAATGDEVYLAYALTVNEGRGIYLRRSEDGSLNWSDPVLAFDAAAAGWSMVDAPRLARTADGGLHLMWSRHELLHGNRPLAYYYVRSLDQGQNWSASPTLVAEGNVQQGRIVADPHRNEVFRIWQDMSDERSVVWYQHSENAGRTWTPAVLLPSLADLSGDLTTLVDPAGRIHLVHVGTNEAGVAQLDNWLWQQSGWQMGSTANFDLLPAGNGRTLSTVISNDGTFMLFLAGMGSAEASPKAESRIYYSWLPIELPAERPALVPVVEEPTPAATAEGSESHAGQQPALTPTVDFLALESETVARTQFGPLDTSSSTGRILAGVLPAGLVVIIGIALGLYALRSRQV
jgi:hypothetical protein